MHIGKNVICGFFLMEIQTPVLIGTWITIASVYAFCVHIIIHNSLCYIDNYDTGSQALSVFSQRRYKQRFKCAVKTWVLCHESLRGVMELDLLFKYVCFVPELTRKLPFCFFLIVLYTVSELSKPLNYLFLF